MLSGVWMKKRKKNVNEFKGEWLGTQLYNKGKLMKNL